MRWLVMTLPYIMLVLSPVILMSSRRSVLLDLSVLCLLFAIISLSRLLIPLLLLPLMLALIQLGNSLYTGQLINLDTLMTFSATNAEESSGFMLLALMSYPFQIVIFLAWAVLAMVLVFKAPASGRFALIGGAIALSIYVGGTLYKYHALPTVESIAMQSQYGQVFSYGRDFYKSFYNVSYKQPAIASLETTKPDAVDAILVIVGESATRLRMSAYGYGRNTTPELSKADVLFQNLVSVGLNTQPNVQAMMTGDVGAISQHHAQDIFRIAKRTGFRSYYIDNNRFVNRDAMYLIARQSDGYFSLNGIGATNPRNDHKLQHDEVVFDDFRQVLKSGQGHKRVIFVHLAGSHFNHNLRYPASFDRFPSHYDNSILYTDYVISELHRLFMSSVLKERAMMIYVADHGLKIPPGCGLGLVPAEETANYGNNDRYYSNMAVPLAFWFNDRFKQKNAEILGTLAKARTKPLDQRFLIWTLADAMGVRQVNGQMVNKLSLFSSSFDYLPRRNTRGDDIDHEIRSGRICKSE